MKRSGRDPCYLARTDLELPFILADRQNAAACDKIKNLFHVAMPVKMNRPLRLHGHHEHFGHDGICPVNDEFIAVGRENVPFTPGCAENILHNPPPSILPSPFQTEVI